MRTKLPATAVVVVATGLAAASPANAAEWNGSYQSDGQCFCSGALPSSLSASVVPTPIGGQTIESVCERVGPGPGLNNRNGRFDKIVYPDPQCGNGPFPAGAGLVDDTCVGTLEPGSSDCQPAGPRWDLAVAYANPVTESTDPKPLAAAQPSADVKTVHIDGHLWREAPPGTAAIGGPVGSRIVLDGDVWLKADHPIFAQLDAEPATATRIEAVEPYVKAPTRDAVAARSPLEPASEDPESLAKRQRTLVAEARERARQREEAGLPPVIHVRQTNSVAMGVIEPAAPELSAATDEALESASNQTLDDQTSVDAAAEAVQPDEANSESGAAPLSALRLPTDTRGSSDEFGYIQAMPISFDIGGGGIALEGSAEIGTRFHVVARGAAANRYSEVLVGAGFHYTPPQADRLTLLITAGIEHGVFPITDGVIELDDADTGVFIGTGSRLVLNPKFELEGGVGYSSFHGGDPTIFGGAYFHVNKNIDLTSRFELGDNDNFGLGLRVYY